MPTTKGVKDAKKLYFVSGGGTGGHIYPAIAVAKALLEVGERVIFIGNKKNLEYKICTENGIEFLNVDVNYMPRKVSLNLIFWLLKTFVAAVVAMSYLLKYKPNAVFATGGYVSAPVLMACAVLGIPYMEHDCDAYPGLVSRIFSKRAKAVSIAFDEASKYLKAKHIFNFGNPVREVFFNANKDASREKMGFKCGAQVLLGGAKTPVLLIMGGSQGAKTINSAAVGLIKHFAGSDKLDIILQTGVKNFDEVVGEIGDIPSNAIIAPYFDDMSIPLSAADLVVSRSGSLSLSEICAVGAPSILVPYPFSASDHQRLNAKVLEEAGASICIEDADLSAEKLISLVESVIFDDGRLRAMGNAARERSKPDALKNIVEKIKEISR